MQYHEVKINLEFEDKAPLTAAGTLAGDISSASLWVDYIFLDTDERRRFAQLSHEYLITQLQFTGDEALVQGNNRVKLNFNHPVQELVWVGIPASGINSNQWTTYTSGGANMTTSAKLQLNGRSGRSEGKQSPLLVRSVVHRRQVQHTLKREALLTRPITTTLCWKLQRGTLVTPVPNGNKVMGVG